MAMFPVVPAEYSIARHEAVQKGWGNAWLHESRGSHGEWTGDGPAGDLEKLGHKMVQDAHEHPEEERHATARGTSINEGGAKAHVTYHKDSDSYDLKLPGERHTGLTSNELNHKLGQSEDVNGKYVPDAS